MLSGVSATLRGGDLVLANLETPITTRGLPLKKFTFRSAPPAAAALRKAGVTLVSLANNHTLDYGRRGLVDTLKALPKYGIESVGAGLNKKAAHKPLIMSKNGLTVGFLSYITFLAPGIPRELARVSVAFAPNRAVLTQNVQQLKSKVDLVIVSFHWGREFHRQHNDLQKRYARAAIDAGADLVLGHHPHVLQPSETYRGKLIVYSLGNFLFFMTRPRTRDSTIFRCRLTENGIENAEFLPVRIRNYRPEIVKRR
jgi:poly-gamma-glutamate synthesis protein (capsule biosynthesis protein)